MTGEEYLSNFKVLLVSSLFFLGLNFYLIIKISIPRKIKDNVDKMLVSTIFADFCSNFSSLIHAVVSFFWGLWVISASGISADQVNTIDENAVLCFSMGYFLSDTLTGLIYDYQTRMMNIHHAIVIVNVVYILSKGRFSNITVAALVVSEASNPFKIMDSILKHIDDAEPFHTTSRVLFAFLFTVCRSDY